MKEIDNLVEIMKTLRDPETGCAWDRVQTIKSILPYSIEEIHELAEAIDSGEWGAVRDELGDLLFHIVFYARMSEEAGHFDLADVVRGICEKLLRRHPHVFGPIEDQGAPMFESWEQIKQAEREERWASGDPQPGILAGIGKSMPAMIRAIKLQKRAACVGFDWPDRLPVLDKLEEEIAELRHEILHTRDDERIGSELGDVLFSCINLARHCGIDPENALRLCNRKFERRFSYIESSLAGQGRSIGDAGLEELEALWQESKNPVSTDHDPQF